MTTAVVVVDDDPTITPTCTATASRRIPPARLVGVELRKMFDTRSGFWPRPASSSSTCSATTAVVTFGAEEDLTYETFAAAIGALMTVIPPMIGILAVTSEWSQRSGLTTSRSCRTAAGCSGRSSSARSASASSRCSSPS